MSDRPLAYSYIRLSTEGQLKGHGRQRQLEQPADYAKQHGLQLATDAQYEDIGISAFKGANVKEGALGKFLAAVEAGLIPKGSYLLVESLDRVSRQAIHDSLSLFLRIIEAGINLVTLQDGHVYRTDHTDPSKHFSDLIISLTIMSRAHEESLTKSRRVGAAWANKRAQGDTIPLTKWCPAWLQLNKDRTHFEPIKERVEVIQSVFEEAASGIGIFRISRRLNQKAIPPWGKSNGWHSSYVAKILSNRAVIGEYQPHKLVNGKRVPTGQPIAKYYPAIIEPELFYRVQQSKSDRRINARGRKGAYFTNLFSGITKCAFCKSPMMFENKGPGPKGGTFLVCEAAKRGMNCNSTRWRYEQFEASFLAFVEQVDLRTLVNGDNSERKSLDDEIQSLEGQRLALREEHSRRYDLLKINPNLALVAEVLGKIQDQLKAVESQLKEAKSKRQALDSTETAFYESKGEIVELVHRLQTQNAADSGDLYKLRAQVSARIKALVKAIEIAPDGPTPFAIELDDGTMRQVNSDERFFDVVFADGSMLRMHPNRDEPLEYDLRTEFDAPDGTNSFDRVDYFERAGERLQKTKADE